MELIGQINKQQHKIKIEQTEDRRYHVEIDGQHYSVDSLELMPHVYSMIHGSASHEVRVHKTSKTDQYATYFQSESFTVEISDPLKQLLEEASGASAKGDLALEAAMPGKVQRLLVKVGDKVEEDQGLVVLVAMKMENELGSPKAGTVSKILVEEGDNVEGGAPLVVVS